MVSCPSCDEPKMIVQETRSTPLVIWRVRVCRHCGWKVTTKETYADDHEQSIPQHIRKPRASKHDTARTN